MAEFESACNFILENEGGLVDNKSDSGGITNFGISLRFLRGLNSSSIKRYGIFEPIDADTIRNLIVDQARLIYRYEFWDKAPFDEINNQIIANYIFDMAVNMGMVTAIKLVQRALCAKSLARHHLRVDGIMGDLTLSAINAQGLSLLPLLIALRIEHYRHIVDANPKYAEFLNGWINRSYIQAAATDN